MAAFLVAEEAGVERRVGEVIEVPGVTEEDLRLSAVDRAMDMVAANPVLGPNEFTRQDYRDRVRERDGRDVSESTVTRYLERLIAAGLVASGERHDERVGRVVVGYWFLEGE